MKVELFAGVHKALRRAGARVLIGLSRGDAAGVHDLLVMHEIHQRVEDQIVIPAIEAKRRGAAARLVDAHTDHENSIAELRRRLAEGIDHRLYLEVTRFLGDAFLHMYEEEVLAQPLLEEIYTQPELAALVERAVGSLTPAEHALFAPHFEP